MSLLVDIVALALVAFIVGWFWLYRPPSRPVVPAGAPVTVTVADGVYAPAEIHLPAGQETTLRFLRRDPSPCAATLLIDELGISADLPVDVPVDVRVRPERPGRYDFTCQMRMYRGTLVVAPVTGENT